jgi:hypothetical protein
MPLSVAKTTDFCPASTAFSVPLAIFLMYVSWLDPFATPPGRAIYAVLRGIFCKFGVPVLLELAVK